MTRYRWEPGLGISGRYRDTRTGRLVPQAVVRRELDAYLANSDDAMKALAETLRGRGVSLADWELAMRREIKRVHLNAVAMERGGWANMRPQDYGRAGQVIREQYAFLRKFANEIHTKEQRLDGRLVQRAKLYGQAGRETFYRSKHANMREAISHVRSKRHARDSCAECFSLDGVWYKLGDPRYKLPGQRICTKNCRCSEEYGAFNGAGDVVGMEAA